MIWPPKAACALSVLAIWWRLPRSALDELCATRTASGPQGLCFWGRLAHLWGGAG